MLGKLTRYVSFAILLALMMGTADARCNTRGASGTIYASVEVVECITGENVIWLQVNQSVPGGTEHEGGNVRLDVGFNAPVEGYVVLNLPNETRFATVVPDGQGGSAATFYVPLRTGSGEIDYTAEGYVEKLICGNAVVDVGEPLRLSAAGQISVDECSSFETDVLERKINGVSERLAIAQKAIYDTLDIVGSQIPDDVAARISSSLKSSEDARRLVEESSYQQNVRKLCSSAKAAADAASYYADKAYAEATAAYAISTNRSASYPGFYEFALFASIASIVYVLFRRK